MTARSLFQIVGVKARKVHRTGQPVRRSSYQAGEREQRYWRPFNKAERNARMSVAEVYDRKHKITRNAYWLGLSKKASDMARRIMVTIKIYY